MWDTGLPKAKVVQNFEVCHRSIVLLLAPSAGWPTELDNVEIYKCPQEVQESSGGHQHRKQVRQMWRRDQSCTHNAQTSHGCNAYVEL